MNNSQLRIEHYLLQLDRQLQGLTVSQRAEIVTEIKSHILDSMEKDPQRDIEAILADLGQPGVVAERYLSAKGLQPRTSSGRRWLKWLAIGVAGCFAMLLITTMLGVWYLSPLVKVDENTGRVVLLGGLIDVNKRLDKVRIGGLEVSEDMKNSVEVSGEEDLSDKNISVIKIPFNTAKLEVESSSDAIIKWDCKSPTMTSLKTELAAGILTLNLDSLNLAKCEITLPAGIASEFHGVNGHMEVTKPEAPMDIALTNGKVNIQPDKSRVYDFEVHVKNGLQDFFPRANNPDAIKVRVSVVNGLVNKD